jgi:2-polyprenyl-3-methyl-5-hydroxy-6-metoxy-1,4-benzoquinol methylase
VRKSKVTSKKYIYEIPDDANHAANKVINWVSSGSDVLEIGCASGIQSRILKETLGCRVTGLEIDPIAAEDARPYCESLIIGSIEEIDLSETLGDRRFDTILFVDVLEHLVDPTTTLKKALPFLKEGGHLIASIPNIAHAAICWELAHGRFDYQKFGLLDNTHIRFFSKKNVAKLFEEAGYRIISWDRVVKSPEETEFNVHCTLAMEQSFLDWISELNPEAHTYQFIVKARPALDEEESMYRQLEKIDTFNMLVPQLEFKVEELKKQNMKLKSQIEWLEKHRFGVLTSLINKPFSKE